MLNKHPSERSVILLPACSAKDLPVISTLSNQRFKGILWQRSSFYCQHHDLPVIEWALMQHSCLDQVSVIRHITGEWVCLVVLSDAVQLKNSPANRQVLSLKINGILERLNSHLRAEQHITRIIVLPDRWLIKNGKVFPLLKADKLILRRRFSGILATDVNQQVVFIDSLALIAV